MNQIFYVSAAIESAIILACLIFVVLLLTARILPPKVNRNGIFLFLNLLFVSGFYLLINVELSSIAEFFVVLFLPSTVSLSLFFYRFNTSWMQQRFWVDRFLPIVPILVLLGAVTLEILHYSYPISTDIQLFRIYFTVYILKYVFPIFGALIFALNFFKIRLEEQSNKDTYTERMVVNLNWCYASLAFYTLFLVGVIISELVNPWISELLFNGSLLALTLYLGYYQIKIVAQYLKSTRVNISQSSGRVILDDTNEEVNPNKSEAQEDNQRANEIFIQLDALVEEESLFLKADLTIHELSQKLEMNSKYLSQAINQQGNLNFNKYINEKRIEHAKKLLLDPTFANFSLEGIGNESGFRSKSTFNTTFKSLTGVTPSEYKKKGPQ